MPRYLLRANRTDMPREDGYQQEFRAALATLQGEAEYAKYGALLQRAAARLDERVRAEEARLEEAKGAFRHRLGLQYGDISRAASEQLFEPFYCQVAEAREQRNQVVRFVEIWKESGPPKP
jgi:hypothetical protein